MSEEKPPKRIPKYNAVAKILYRAKEPITVREIMARTGLTEKEVRASMQDAKRLCIRHGAAIMNYLGNELKAEPDPAVDEIGAAQDAVAKGYKRATTEEYQNECNKAARRALNHIKAKLEDLFLWQQSGKAPPDFDFAAAEASLRASAGGISTPFVFKAEARDDEWETEEELLESETSLVPPHLTVIANEMVDDPDPETEVGDDQ